ncbi:hypothetical protein [Polynucleobacter necessarius]|uniref:hypothetical protein n=1 Tax=Polynucleobacter necessarius TaxID=576610 RepID=UPI0018D5A47A|nr:hypothetical protein [Polynucleobacter necessarius]
MVSAQIKTMSADDVELAMTWAANEGWNPGLNDAAAFQLADPTGFLSLNLKTSALQLSQQFVMVKILALLVVYCAPIFSRRGLWLGDMERRHAASGRANHWFGWGDFSAR